MASATWDRRHLRGSIASMMLVRAGGRRLPLGPTGYGNSPYQSLSSFAGNALLISPGASSRTDCCSRDDCECHFPTDVVDYECCYSVQAAAARNRVGKLPSRRRKDLRSLFDDFCAKQAHWLEDYALFRALKARYHGAYYLEWPAEIVQRKPDALAQARRELARQIDQVRFAQFLLFRQGDQLKDYAHAKGIALIGDLPFFVSPDSSDVWANPELFLLDEQRRPASLQVFLPIISAHRDSCGAIPSTTGTPFVRTGYQWCIDRLRALLVHADVIRLDHFRGFAAAWHVPAGAPTAQSGQWVPGPGASFFRQYRRS